MLYADLETRLPEHTLVLSDRLSMAHGLELRAPFLDHELATFCAAMPPHLKIRPGTTKYALREAVRDRLPAEILRRPKQGFMLPMAFWMRPEVLGQTRKALLEGPLVREGWVRATAIERLLDEHLRRRADHHVRIWMLISLDVWHREFFGGPQTAPRESRPLAEVVP
jgi:asparagine synthase (glutamine-hydrolysing)